MKLHDRSCILDAFAYLFDLPPHVVATRCGHWGKEDGFHTQELIEFCLCQGYAVTHIERTPVMQNPKSFEIKAAHCIGEPEDRFKKRIRGSKGVLLGQKPYSMMPHAVAYNGHEAYDASIDLFFPILTSDDEIADSLFVPHAFLKVDKIL